MEKWLQLQLPLNNSKFKQVSQEKENKILCIPNGEMGVAMTFNNPKFEEG